MLYPDSLNNAINSFKRLPGIGEKSAERFALSILDLDEEEIEDFSQSIKTCKERLHRCKTCGHLTDKEECSICTDTNRKSNIICVVEDYKSVFMFEKSGTFQGKYHVLNGLISPMDGIYPEDININTLINRIENLDDVEVIVALKPTIEGETTTLYIKKIFENKGIKVSRLSYGIPMGVDIDYLDSITLDRALSDRIEL
ncbi:MAG: recombination mediator RecR [Bacilli bacterium]|nr:recombination mediator RecR [Bacilli bacterium]